MAKHTKHLFDIEKIDSAYQDLQSKFVDINQQLNTARDPFDDEVRGNLLHAYRYINTCLLRKSKKHVIDRMDMLELNAIVHMGDSRLKRREYANFIAETEAKFSLYIDALMEWYQRHEKEKDDPYKIAAGLYVRILTSPPQLFIDGNHRTGSLIANYYLLMSGEMPLIVTVDNAVEFFNLATNVKFPQQDIGSRFKRATGWRDEVHAMRDFLKKHALPFTRPADAESKLTPGLVLTP